MIIRYYNISYLDIYHKGKQAAVSHYVEDKIIEALLCYTLSNF